MKIGLKREFDEVFIKKMIEFMSCFFMEFVFWKFFFEFFFDKLKLFFNIKNYIGES